MLIILPPAYSLRCAALTQKREMTERHFVKDHSEGFADRTHFQGHSRKKPPDMKLLNFCRCSLIVRIWIKPAGD